MVDDFDNQPNNIKSVLVDLNFQLGSAGARQFKKFIAAVNTKNYSKAAVELTNSLLFKQTPERVKNNIKLLTQNNKKSNVITPTISKTVENLDNNDNYSNIVLLSPVAINSVVSNVAEQIGDLGKDLIQYKDRFLTKIGQRDPQLDNTIVTNIEVKPTLSKQFTDPSLERTSYKKDEYKYHPENTKILGGTPQGYMMYSNSFDLRKGFNYIPVKNKGNSTHGDKYKNVLGMAHFLLDADISSNYIHPATRNFIDITIKTNKPANSGGSTVTNPYLPIIKQSSNNQVNVTYKRLSNITNEELDNNVKAYLRQYKFTDLDFESTSQNKVVGFKNNIAAITTKSGHNTGLIYPRTKTGKDQYGKFGGASVVFLIDKENIAVDFAGSINQIKNFGKELIKNYGIKPDELIIGYHDVGSFSAKPIADKNNELYFTQWSGFNNEHYTGGGLAIPKK